MTEPVQGVEDMLLSRVAFREARGLLLDYKCIARRAGLPAHRVRRLLKGGAAWSPSDVVGISAVLEMAPAEFEAAAQALRSISTS